MPQWKLIAMLIRCVQTCLIVLSVMKAQETNYLYPRSDFSVALFGENKRIVHFAFVMHKLFHTTT